ncbi:hypothetical protein KKA94_03205, partial [Patescibacteria group bacterium]|nr:hypothetical protein [Patescibacteria group bacterium]
YNARYYNPKIGRFISRDNFMGRTGDVVSKNRYVYVKNNPLKYVDPTGNDAEKSWLANISSAVRHFSSGNPLLSYAIEQAAEEVTRWALENPLDAAEIGVGSTPIGGEGLDIIEAVSGKELFTGNQLSEFERVLTGGSTFVPFVGGALVRKGVKNVILYHGTTYNRARKILGSGFKTSQRVYMSTEIDTALEFGMEKVSSVVGAGKGAVVKMRVPKEIFDELMRQGHIVERPIEFFGGGRMETVITPQATKVLNQLKNSANSGVEYIISNLIH